GGPLERALQHAGVTGRCHGGGGREPEDGESDEGALHDTVLREDTEANPVPGTTGLVGAPAASGATRRAGARARLQGRAHSGDSTVGRATTPADAPGSRAPRARRGRTGNRRHSQDLSSIRSVRSGCEAAPAPTDAPARRPWPRCRPRTRRSTSAPGPARARP